MIYIALYLIAIIGANLSTAYFGPSASVLNAFLFIGLDLTGRDKLHEAWQGRHLWLKMLALITAGSLLSYLLNRNAGPIAIASFAAFIGAGLADTAVYTLLGHHSRFLKINGSNTVAAAVDSLLFPILAFGFPPMWGIILGQFLAKTLGGFLWSLILDPHHLAILNLAGEQRGD